MIEFIVFFLVVNKLFFFLYHNLIHPEGENPPLKASHLEGENQATSILHQTSHTTQCWNRAFILLTPSAFYGYFLIQGCNIFFITNLNLACNDLAYIMTQTINGFTLTPCLSLSVELIEKGDQNKDKDMPEVPQNQQSSNLLFSQMKTAFGLHELALKICGIQLPPTRKK